MNSFDLRPLGHDEIMRPQRLTPHHPRGSMLPSRSDARLPVADGTTSIRQSVAAGSTSSILISELGGPSPVFRYLEVCMTIRAAQGETTDLCDRDNSYTGLFRSRGEMGQTRVQAQRCAPASRYNSLIYCTSARQRERKMLARGPCAATAEPRVHTAPLRRSRRKRAVIVRNPH